MYILLSLLLHNYYIYLDGISVGDGCEVGRDSGYYGVGDAVGYAGDIDVV